MLRRAAEPEGYCVNCAVAEFLWAFGCRAVEPDPSSLRFKPIQDQFVKIMQVSRAEAAPREIDWEHVIAHWDLPFRVGRKMVSPVDHPTPPMQRRRRR